MELAPAVRKILDDAGLRDAKIMVTGDLNEYKIQELIAARVPIDSFGVGTDLATSADAPSLGVIYKMVEAERDGKRRYVSSAPTRPRFPAPNRFFATPMRRAGAIERVPIVPPDSNPPKRCCVP